MLLEPLGWKRGRRQFVGLCAVVLVFTAAAFYAGIAAALNGQWGEAFSWITMSVMPAMMFSALIAVQLGHTTLRMGHDSSGTTFRPDRRFGVLVLVGCAIGCFGIALFAVLLLSGQVDTAMGRRTRISLIVGAAFALSAVGSAAVKAWRRGGIGYVKLTQQGVDVADMVRTKSCGWDELDTVSDHSEVTKRTRRAVVLSPRSGNEVVIEGADFYVPTGAPLYWMIRHYWRHPEDRMELVDARAGERLREGHFDLT